MKQLLTFKPHSFIDVITNSSTELFVCDTDKEIVEIKKILEDKWNHFKALYEDNDYEKSVWEVLDVKVVTKDDIEEDTRWLDGYGIDMKVGDIHIIGTEDNSIPYEFFDVIKSTFNAESYHLG